MFLKLNNEIIEKLEKVLKDKGTTTIQRYGVNAAMLDEWLGRTSTSKDMANLDLSTAVKIYYTNFYFKPRLNVLPTEIQPIVFDLVFVHGSLIGLKVLQTALRALGERDVVADGWIGLQSGEACEQAIRLHGISKVINTIVDTRNGFIDEVAKLDANLKQFAPGWKAHSDTFRR